MIRTLLREVRQYKAASIATPLFMILEVLMEMVIPFLMASIIDDGVNAGDIHHIYRVGAVMIVAASSDFWPAWAAGASGPRLPRDSPGICAKPCLTISRPFLFLILINTAPRAW